MTAAEATAKPETNCKRSSHGILLGVRFLIADIGVGRESCGVSQDVRRSP